MEADADALAVGKWLDSAVVNGTTEHEALYGVSNHAFKRYPYDWIFGTNGPLAMWCDRFPNGGNVSHRDVYQFGVYTGGSLRGVNHYFGWLNVHYGTIWGFDSFEGLPKESGGVPAEGKHWNPGGFSAADALHEHSYARLEQSLLQHIGRKNGGVQLVRGFYSASLTPTLARERSMQPALYVDVDCDLYISAVQALDWLFCSGLIDAGVTVFRYDDWSEMPSPHPRLNISAEGEKKAHLEITLRHQVTWVRPALQRNWFVPMSYTLDEAHCTAQGYPTPLSRAGALNRAAVDRDGATSPKAPTNISSDVEACLTRVRHWRRPYVNQYDFLRECNLQFVINRAEIWSLGPPKVRPPKAIRPSTCAWVRARSEEIRADFERQKLEREKAVWNNRNRTRIP